MDDSTVLRTGGVQPLTDADSAAWDDFVRAHPDATFFHLSRWRDVLERAFGLDSHYLFVRDELGISGVLPLAEVRSLLFGHSLVSTPFCVYGGIVARTEAARAALESAAVGLGKRLGVDHVEMRNRSRQHPDWPSKDLHVTFRRPIFADAEKNLAAIPRKQRAMVRKAIQRGLQATPEVDSGDLYSMYSESLRNLGTPVFAQRYLDVLKEAFGDDCEILCVRQEGKPVAAVMSFYFRDEVLPYYGGGSAAARAAAANDFMYWAVMERARERGAGLFDFGRSKRDSGSYSFKKNWGFEPEPLHYEYYLVRSRAVPNVSPANPKYRLMISLWQRLPLWLSRLAGPLIAHKLG